MNKSPKEKNIEDKILALVGGKAREVAQAIFDDEEIAALQDYANKVSIVRLGYNDHGPVHMKTAALNAMILSNLLTDAGVKLNLEQEEIGTVDDSRVAVLVATLMHDIGMSVGRENHEIIGISLAMPIITRLLTPLYSGDLRKLVTVRSMIVEGIAGHMATQKIHSLEAGLVLIGDGCDMEKGRARITTQLSTEPKIGDIHRYSASAIQKIRLTKGEQKPIRITAEMSQSVGFFQIEAVLYPKITSSPVKPYIELYAGITGETMLCYL